MSNALDALPFDLDLGLPRHGQEAELSISFVRGEPDPEDEEETTLAPCDEVLHVFSLAQAARMLSGGASEPRRTVMEPLSRDTPEDGPSWRYRFRVREIEPASFLVLLALLTQTKYAYAPLSAVAITTSGRVGPVIAAEELLRLPREVARISAPPFAVERAKNLPRKRFVVTFRFRDPVSPASFQEIAELLNIWDHLAVLGGFLFDFKEQEKLPPFGEPAHVARDVIEHRVRFYDGHESGIDALVNLGAALHADGRPLLSMEID
ncbi:hypothetical protein [Sorangium sp. So ce542]|uniref:hypothetical protein n=1 Tax=Sorangium sp. So ce542 TaxID=3133316 RepID=UPI003F5DFD8F